MINTEAGEKDAYLYKVGEGKLMVRLGILRPIGEDAALFYVKKEREGEKMRYRVSAMPGEVYNGAVWYTEPDETAAAQAFIRWAEAKKDECNEKILKLDGCILDLQSYITP